MFVLMTYCSREVDEWQQQPQVQYQYVQQQPQVQYVQQAAPVQVINRISTLEVCDSRKMKSPG